MDDLFMFNDLYDQFLALVGVGAFIFALVGLGKTVKLVKDGDSPKWVAGLSLAGMVALFVLQVGGWELDLATIDTAAAGIAVALESLIGVLGMFVAARTTYAVAKGFPVLGKSHTPAPTRPAGR